MSTTVGAAAIDRANTAPTHYTSIEGSNPSTVDGKCTEVNFFLSGISENITIYIAERNGATNEFRLRSSVTLSGQYAVGVHSEIVNLDVRVGDYIAFFHDLVGVGYGGWDRALSGGVQTWSYNGEGLGAAWIDFGLPQAGYVTSINGSVIAYVVYPGDATARVTGLVHRYAKGQGEGTGVYSLEVLIGDVKTDWGVLEPQVRLSPAAQPAVILPLVPVPTQPAPTQPPPSSAPPSTVPIAGTGREVVYPGSGGVVTPPPAPKIIPGPPVKPYIPPAGTGSVAGDIMAKNAEMTRLLAEQQRLNKALTAPGITQAARDALKVRLDAVKFRLLQIQSQNYGMSAYE